MNVPCFFCDSLVDTEQAGAWRRVTGWVTNKGAKGFRTEQHTGEWAHERCVNDSQRGLLGQTTLDGS